MPVEILMPELGESVHEGTVSRWLKKVGEFVKEDEPVVEIMTDKVNTELQAPASGVLIKILIPEGEQVEVFKPMGLIDDGTEVETAPAETAPTPQAEKVESVPHATPSVSGDQGGRKWYTPVVRSIAKSNNISEAQLASISGTGAGGRVTKKDLEEFLAGGVQPVPQISVAPAAPIEVKPSAPVVAGPDQEIVQLVGMRKMIADAMVRSSQVPVVSTLTEVDVTQMVQFRERNKENFQSQFGVKLTYTPFFIKAITETLMEFPLVNASLQGDQIVMNKNVHMGIAVSLGPKGDQGLIVPVIRDANTKSLIDLAKDLEQIAAKARSNALSVSDVQGGTFTLTNPGSYGAVLGTPMINAPQAAILGTYTIKQSPVIIDGMIAIRSIMNLVLTYDHRLIDGMAAGRFLQAVKGRLETFDFFK
ncbi:MAG: 2-oxo acid dehydrogenase subunit E2 [Armatimonadetes bacterium]|nr:2-oxo acid dehydrogenase subunit E2 [Armatimonadota bacterium]